MSDSNDLELAVRVRVEGQQALDSTAQSTKVLGATATTSSAQFDGLQAQIKSLTATVTALSAALPAASSGLNQAGTAARGLSSSSMQAQQALRGMGAELGVAMPRYISRFLVSLGPVAGALSAAFSVVAIVGILEMLPRLYQAIEDFGDKLGGVTERTRKQMKELVEQNDKFQFENLGNAEKLRDLNTTGMEGSAKTALQMRDLTAAAKDYGKALGEASKELRAAQAVESSYSIWSPSGDRKRAEADVDRLQEKVNKLTEETRKRAVNSPEMRSLQAEQSVKVADEHRATQLQAIEGAKALGSSIVDENEKTAKQLRELRLISFADEDKITKQAADDRLRIENSSAQAVYNVKSRQPGANKALLAEELKNQKQAAQQRADAAKQDIDIQQRIRDGAEARSITQTQASAQRQLEEQRVLEAKGSATRASGYSTRTINANVKPGLEVDAIQKTYNEAVKLADALQKIEQASIDAAETRAKALSDQFDAVKKADELGKVQLDREKMIADITTRRDEARIAAEEKIADLQKKRLDEAKGEAGSLFDAIHGGGAGVQKYLNNMTEQLEKGIFVNLLTMGKGGGGMGSLMDNMHNGVPGQTNTDGTNSLLGNLLSGSILGRRTPTSALKTSDKSLVESGVKFDEAGGASLSPDILTRKDNTVALTELNTSVTQLTMVLQGKQPSLMNGAVVPTSVMGVPGSAAAMDGAVGSVSNSSTTVNVQGGSSSTSTTSTVTSAPGSAGASGSSPVAVAAPAAAGAAAGAPGGGSTIGTALALLTLGAGLTAAATQENRPAEKVLQGPGQGNSGMKSYSVTGVPEFTAPQIMELGSTAASVGFGALVKSGVVKPGTSFGNSAVGDFANGFVKGPTQGLGTLNSSGGISGGVIGGWSDPNVSWGQEAGQIAGLGAGVATGVMSAIKGFSQGGGRGITSGIGAIAGTAAMLDPEPISKGILTAVAAVSGIVKGIFGDPKANRQRDETNTLAQNAFVAPPTINGVQALGGAGNNLNYNKYGKLQLSPFAGYNVTDPTQYQNQLTGAIFTTPGSVTAGDYVGTPTAIAPTAIAPIYKAATGNGGTTVNLTVHALDSQSIMDRSSDIGMAVYKELNAGGALGLRVQQSVLGA